MRREDAGLVVRRRQAGMTFWSLLYVLFTLGVLGIVAIKSVPVYLNAYGVRATLEWAADRPDLRDADAVTIQRAIQRRFDTGYVDNLRGRDVAVEQAGSGRELSVSYEVRRPLMFNLAMVYSFDESVPMTGGDDSK